ncbi:MAG: hypothetical protein LBF34_00945 [Puniceicoccales bacterium]|nr:hypothetical protein [Puniceicoccales bacterium]
MESIHKLISVVTLISATYGGMYASGSEESYGGAGESTEIMDYCFPDFEVTCHWFRNFSEEFKEKFRIGPWSLDSRPWSISPVFLLGQRGPVNDIMALLSYISGIGLDKKLYNVLQEIARESGGPFSQKFLAALAITYEKNIIFLEVGSGVRFKPDFFEKLTIVKFFDGQLRRRNLGMFKEQSDWLEDMNILGELDEEWIVNLFGQGNKTATFVYHKGLGKVFYCGFYNGADKRSGPGAEEELALSRRVKEMNEALASRLDYRLARATSELLKGVPLSPPRCPDDYFRIIIEEIEICDGERKSRGLKPLKNLKSSDEVKAYFTELGQLFGREIANPLSYYIGLAPLLKELGYPIPALGFRVDEE